MVITVVPSGRTLVSVDISGGWITKPRTSGLGAPSLVAAVVAEAGPAPEAAREQPPPPAPRTLLSFGYMLSDLHKELKRIFANVSISFTLFV